jgi:copper chaperone CopZ
LARLRRAPSPRCGPFLGLSTALLAAGFYFEYRRPKPGDDCEGEVCAPDSRSRKLAKPMLWLATAAVLALAFFPSYGGRLVRARGVRAAVATVRVQTAQLKICGMDCPVCANLIQKKLTAMPGVVRAEVSYPAGSATVGCDPAEISPSQIVDAVNSTGYTAAVSN